jgi:hypothetical protein
MNVSNYKVWKLLDIYVDEARFNQDLSNIDTFGSKLCQPSRSSRKCRKLYLFLQLQKDSFSYWVYYTCSEDSILKPWLICLVESWI